MNYNYMLYFSVLAQTEHYTTAAARLGISQPALSSAIRNLENALGGVKLFKKVGRNIQLTDEGRFYQKTVDEAIHKLHSASLLLRDSKTLAPIVIRMGIVSGTLDGLLASQIVQYSRNNSRIRFHIMPCTHPLAIRSYIEPQEVISEPQVVFNYNVDKSFLDWTTGSPSDAAVICTVDTSRAALDLVSAGLGITFIPNECVEPRPGIAYVPLKNWHQALYMCILYDKWLEQPIWDFIELVVKTIREKKCQ